MAYGATPDFRERFGAGVLTLLATILVGMALLSTTAPAKRARDDTLRLFNIVPMAAMKDPDTPSPPPQIKAPDGKSTPVPSAAPERHAPPMPVDRPAPPAPLPRALRANADLASTTDPSPPAIDGHNVSEAVDPGDGKQNIGTGSGGEPSPPQKLGGIIRNTDIPPNTITPDGKKYSVVVRFRIQQNGRTGNCTVKRHSGNPALDALTCRLVEQRFVYMPATDRTGDAVAAEAEWTQTYWHDDP